MMQAPAHGVLWPEAESYSHEAGLRRLRQRGWRPRCVYDIGASSGPWTACASAIFPLAEYHLFEPLANVNDSYRASLSALQAKAGLRVKVHAVAMDSGEGTLPFGVASDPMGSSLLVTEASPYFPTVVQVPTSTLDAYRAGHGLPQPDLIKLDTQGSELRILAGAQDTLRRAELLIVETWLERGYGEKTPLLYELVSWLQLQSFRAIDALGGYREGPKLLSIDLLFARADAVLDRK